MINDLDFKAAFHGEWKRYDDSDNSNWYKKLEANRARNTEKANELGMVLYTIEYEDGLLDNWVQVNSDDPLVKKVSFARGLKHAIICGGLNAIKPEINLVVEKLIHIDEHYVLVEFNFENVKKYITEHEAKMVANEPFRQLYGEDVDKLIADVNETLGHEHLYKSSGNSLLGWNVKNSLSVEKMEPQIKPLSTVWNNWVPHDVYNYAKRVIGDLHRRGKSPLWCAEHFLEILRMIRDMDKEKWYPCNDFYRLAELPTIEEDQLGYEFKEMVKHLRNLSLPRQKFEEPFLIYKVLQGHFQRYQFDYYEQFKTLKVWEIKKLLEKYEL